jgi:hypothetical protein
MHALGLQHGKSSLHLLDIQNSERPPRNGGHITPLLYHDYPELKEKHGIEMANSIVRFRLAHLGELIRVGEEENILADSQCREVETFDVFYDQQTLDGAIQNLAAYLDDMPDQAGMWRVIGAEECTDVSHGF